jgi:molybdopterin/thiamine biosynthesis adenylyltransferase
MMVPGMTSAKQSLLLSASCVLLAGEEPIETVLQHLITAGVGRLTILGDSLTLCRMSDLCAVFNNPDTTVNLIPMDGHDPEESVFNGVNLVIEGSLDWQTKLRVSDLCMRMKIPMIHSGSSGLRFQLFTMVPGKSACLRCALPASGIDDFPITPVARDTFGPVANCAGSLMALEAIKLIAGIGIHQGNVLWKIDGLRGDVESVRGLDPRQDCPDCGRAAIGA